MAETYGYDKTPTPPRDYDVNKVPAEIRKRTEWVKSKFTGEDVAEAYRQVGDIAGIYAGEAKRIAEQTQYRQDTVETDFDTLQRSNTEEAYWGAEIIAASAGSPTLKGRLDDMAADTSIAMSKVDSLITNVVALGVPSDGTDSTDLMQSLINTYRELYVPPGNYTWGALEIPSDTYVFLHDAAKVTSTGSVISREYSPAKDYTHNAVVPQTRGRYTVNVVSTLGVEIGDTVAIYDAMWKSPTEWEAHSLGENNDWWKRQIVKVSGVGEGYIEIEEPLEFELTASGSRIEYIEMSADIKIRGGQWSIEHEGIGFYMKKVINFEFLSSKIKSDTATRIISTEYATEGIISGNKIKTSGTSAIFLSYFSKGYRISDNNIVTSTRFTGDSAIQIYSYSTENFVYANHLLSRGLLTSSQHMGIALHTVQNNYVTNNTVVGYMYGISSWFGAKHNVFNDNNVSYNHVCGMFIHSSWYTSIRGNIFHSNGLHERYADQRRGAIYFDNESKYIDIENNDFHDNREDIVILDDMSHIHIVDNKSNQSLGNFLRLSKRNALTEIPTFKYSVIKGNRYRPKTSDKDFINAYDFYVTDNLITDNKAFGGRYGIYGQQGFRRNMVSNNKFISQQTAIYLSSESTFNRFYHNQIESCTTGFSAAGQAKLNDYIDNQFNETATKYDFTDAFNFASDNQKLANTAPVGYKVHSIEGTSLIKYKKKIDATNWRSVSEYVA